MPAQSSKERHASRKKRNDGQFEDLQYLSSFYSGLTASGSRGSLVPRPSLDGSIFSINMSKTRPWAAESRRVKSSPNIWLTSSPESPTKDRSSTTQTDDHRGSTVSSLPRLDSLSRRVLSRRSWIEKHFCKRECTKYIPSPQDHTICSCGRPEYWHAHGSVTKADATSLQKWHPTTHTEQRVTDAYGTIEFQGGPHPSKAQYIRLSSFDTKPEHVLALLLKHWGLELPKLLITIHGGTHNFELQPKLKRVFKTGLLKVARTSGAWIITNGTNTGVARQVGDAISDRTSRVRKKVVAIGIAPWGMLDRKEDLIGRDILVPYHSVSSSRINTSVLSSDHSYFLLADNGTTGKYGGEIMFRKKFEKHIAQQKITNDYHDHGVPIICVVLEGGANTIHSVFEYVTGSPPIPVVVCDGSGRAADLLAFTHKYTTEDGEMAPSLRDQLIKAIKKTFVYTQEQAEKLFSELMMCVQDKELITVFSVDDEDESNDIDLAILTALLKGTTTNPVEQLNLTLIWDRVDIARSIFVHGQDWPEETLEVAMMDALINDRVDFVKLLLENGVSMHTFLTITRLEDLYNTRYGPTNTLKYLVRDIRKHVPSHYRFTLLDVGSLLQHLMGGGFRSDYCRKRFRQKYDALKQPNSTVGNIISTLHFRRARQAEELFPYPFHDLMIWAVLMKRQKMALFMWQHGKEALAKALVAGRLYTAMAFEAEQDELEIELSQEFRSYADEFLNLALELLEHCYKIDDDYTQQLLTYELKNFSEQTCLGLAVMANHRRFIAHTCCQVLLNDLWMGGLRMRKNTSLKVIMGILLPPYIFNLDFKSKEELQLMPQTMEEHLDHMEDHISISEMSMSSLTDNQDFAQQDDMTGPNSTVKRLSFAKDSGINGNGAIGGLDSSIYSTPFEKKKSPLRMGRKVHEFYNAPVTKFWIHAMAYLAFLILYIYVILERLHEEPTIPEYYVMAFVITMGMEKIRQIIVSEPATVSMKLVVYFTRLWNVVDTMGVLLFLMGMTLRFIPDTQQDAILIYCLDLVFWNIRVLEMMSVNKYLGPYVKIIGKLIRDLVYFSIILFVVITSFGVLRQTVNYQLEETTWPFRLRNVWLYPYFMIYGELYVEEIDPCDDPDNHDELGNCMVYGSWVSPLCMFVFCFANLLNLNLLVARFNTTFARVNAVSREIWMFQRYELILQYQLRPILPPPFILLSHIFLAIKSIKHRCKGKQDYFDNGLKLFLSHEDIEKLHDFEQECMEDLDMAKDLKQHNSLEEHIKVISERVETVSLQLSDVNINENLLRLSLGDLDHRMNHMDDLRENLYEAVKCIKLMDSKDDDLGEYGLDDITDVLPPQADNNGSNITEAFPESLSVGSSEWMGKSHQSPSRIRKFQQSPYLARILQQSPSLARKLQQSPSLTRKLQQSPSLARNLQQSPSLAQKLQQSPHVESAKKKIKSDKPTGSTNQKVRRLSSFEYCDEPDLTRGENINLSTLDAQPNVLFSVGSADHSRYSRDFKDIDAISEAPGEVEDITNEVPLASQKQLTKSMSSQEDICGSSTEKDRNFSPAQSNVQTDQLPEMRDAVDSSSPVSSNWSVSLNMDLHPPLLPTSTLSSEAVSMPDSDAIPLENLSTTRSSFLDQLDQNTGSTNSMDTSFLGDLPPEYSSAVSNSVVPLPEHTFFKQASTFRSNRKKKKQSEAKEIDTESSADVLQQSSQNVSSNNSSRVTAAEVKHQESQDQV